MNKKARQMILYYLKNLINSEYEIIPGLFIYGIKKYSSYLFGFDLDLLFKSNDNNINNDIKREFIFNLINGKLHRNNALFKEKGLYKRISDAFNSQKSDYNIDITHPDFDKNFTLICDTFDLQKNCRILLLFLIAINKIARFDTLLEQITDISRNTLSSNFQLISNICKIPENEILQLLSRTGPLVESGIISIEIGYEYNLTSEFSRLLTMNFNTTAEVSNFLIGTPLSTTLKRENFDYISNDFDKISGILSGAIKNKNTGINILIYGYPGTGKTEMAKTICNTAGLRLYTTSENKENKDSRLSNLAHIQTILKNDNKSVILFDEAEDVFSLSPVSRLTPSKLYINRILENNKRPVIWITNNLNTLDDAYIRRFTTVLKMTNPDERAKINSWQRVFQKHKVEFPEQELKRLINKYPVPISVIDTAVRNAKITNDCKMIDYTLENLMVALTGKSSKNTNPNVVKFNTQLLNTDIDLTKLAHQIKDKKLNNFSFCLYGAPGTGKTAFCEYLADLLEINIIKKRASDIVDSFVGETEKNISQAFREARTQKAMLVFDEADSFLMDRKNAVRSWEVSHVNEMLTQMESAEYPFVCTTNLMDNIDKAALRRFTFKVKYDFLTPDQVVAAFQIFFNLTISKDEVIDLVNLTPGDFAVVKKQADIFDITNKSEFLSRLEQEQQVKKLQKPKTKIGFHI